MRYSTIHRIQRLVILVSLTALLGIALLVARVVGYNIPGLNALMPQTLVPGLFNRQIALISGHAGNDSGAVCSDAAGKPTITEAAVNAQVVELAAQQLRRGGADLLVLEEYDERLQGLKADVLLSVHADSCIKVSGYKAVRSPDSPIGATADRLVACLDREYAKATQLKPHTDTITHNMTEYHAFRAIDPLTPAAILEIGFLGGDQALLTQHPELVAQGIAQSIICFLQPASD